MPPSLMFGHEMFSSIAATPSASDRTFATSTYSSSVVPQMLTNTVAPAARSSGRRSRTKRWTPMPCRPMAFSMPAGVSTMRVGRVAFALGEEQALDATPPSEARSTTAAVFDAVAEAAAGGDERVPERQRADARRQSPRQCSHTSVAASNTGPPMHERTWWKPLAVFTGTTQE